MRQAHRTEAVPLWSLDHDGRAMGVHLFCHGCGRVLFDNPDPEGFAVVHGSARAASIFVDFEAGRAVWPESFPA